MKPRFDPSERRFFIGGSDARIVMGSDEKALLCLWREKRGEAEPEDLSGNLIVQLGLIAEASSMMLATPLRWVNTREVRNIRILGGQQFQFLP